MARSTSYPTRRSPPLPTCSIDYSVATVNVSVDFSAHPDKVTELLKNDCDGYPQQRRIQRRVHRRSASARRGCGKRVGAHLPRRLQNTRHPAICTGARVPTTRPAWHWKKTTCCREIPIASIPAVRDSSPRPSASTGTAEPPDTRSNHHKAAGSRIPSARMKVRLQFAAYPSACSRASASVTGGMHVRPRQTSAQAALALRPGHLQHRLRQRLGKSTGHQLIRRQANAPSC